MNTYPSAIPGLRCCTRCRLVTLRCVCGDPARLVAREAELARKDAEARFPWLRAAGQSDVLPRQHNNRTQLLGDA